MMHPVDQAILNALAENSATISDLKAILSDYSEALIRKCISRCVRRGWIGHELAHQPTNLVKNPRFLYHLTVTGRLQLTIGDDS